MADKMAGRSISDSIYGCNTLQCKTGQNSNKKSSI